MGTIVSPATWALGAARTGRQPLATLPVPGWAERLRTGSLWLPGSSASFGGAGTRPRGAPTEGTCAPGLRPAGGRVPGERGDRPRPAPASRVPHPRPHSPHAGSLAGAARDLRSAPGRARAPGGAAGGCGGRPRRPWRAAGRGGRVPGSTLVRARRRSGCGGASCSRTGRAGPPEYAAGRGGGRGVCHLRGPGGREAGALRPAPPRSVPQPVPTLCPPRSGRGAGLGPWSRFSGGRHRAVRGPPPA